MARQTKDSKGSNNTQSLMERKVPPMTFFEEFVASVILLALCSTYFVIPAVCVLLTWRLYASSMADALSWTVLAILGGLAVVPTPVIASLRTTWVLKVVAKYFGFRWIDESGVGLKDLNDPQHTQNFISVWFPHGIIPLGGFLSASEFDERMPGYFGKMAVAPALLHVPLLRTVFGSFGAIPNDKRSMMKALNKSNNMALFPGGIAELFLSSRSREVLYLQQRKGFIKIALQTGTPIIPVYVFGHTQMFDQISNIRTIAAVSRFLRASATVFWGRFGLPLPYRTPVTFIRGKPIFVKKVESPTQEQIDELHSKVVSAVQGIFEKFKGQAGEEYQNKKLEIE